MTVFLQAFYAAYLHYCSNDLQHSQNAYQLLPAQPVPAAAVTGVPGDLVYTATVSFV